MSSQKNALNLLSNYGTDSSSDDDVSGPKVSTKRMQRFDREVTEAELNSRKTMKRLPVPDVITKDLKQSSEDSFEDPSQFCGKIRSFPHERGNWATYVFIRYETNSVIESLIQTLTLSVSNTTKLESIEHFHVSLTKTVILKHHWIDSFVKTIQEKVTLFKSFILCFDQLAVYCNEERTRTFLGLSIKSGFDTLSKLVHKMDESLSEFNLPVFYKNPSFHMSIAWTVGDFEKYFNSILPELNGKVQQVFSAHPDESYIQVENVQCKCGNKCFNFNLT